MKKWSLAHETDGLPQEVVRQISLLKQLGPHANVVRLIDQFHLANHANQLSAPVVWLCFESCQSNLKDYMVRGHPRQTRVRQGARAVREASRQRHLGGAAATPPLGITWERRPAL